jgi:hypothetical protein
LKGYHPDTTENIPESSTITNFSGRPYYFYLLLAAIRFVVLSFIGVVNVIDVANVVDAVRCIYFWLILEIDFKGFYDAVYTSILQ